MSGARTLAWLAVMGALGTLARYGLQGLVQRVAGGAFPWGTFAVNALGCFLFGVVWSLASERLVIGGQARTILLVGFMGAFTTFSTFAFETAELMRDGEWLFALANCLGQVIAGLVLVGLGIALGKAL